MHGLRPIDKPDRVRHPIRPTDAIDAMPVRQIPNPNRRRRWNANLRLVQPSVIVRHGHTKNCNAQQRADRELEANDVSPKSYRPKPPTPDLAEYSKSPPANSSRRYTSTKTRFVSSCLRGSTLFSHRHMRLNTTQHIQRIHRRRIFSAATEEEVRRAIAGRELIIPALAEHRVDAIAARQAIGAAPPSM